MFLHSHSSCLIPLSVLTLFHLSTLYPFKPLSHKSIQLNQKMKNKLLICFRPVTIETDEPVDDRRVSKLLTVANDRNWKISKLRSSSFSDKESRNIARNPSQIGNSSRKFCQDLKSILVEASLQKQRACDRHAGTLMLRSKSHDSRKISSCLQNPKSVETDFKATRSNSMASFTSCPRSVSERKHYQPLSSNKSLSRSMSLSLPQSFNQEKQSISDGSVPITCSCSNQKWLVFVMVLFVIVCLGRVCGILFTTILFYFLPRRSCIDWRSENVVKLPETEREYKKRAIMERLLERNHRDMEGN